MPVDVARLETAGAVLDVVVARAEYELADRLDRRRPRTEAEGPKLPCEVVAPQKPDLRIEVVADHQLLELHAVAVAVVIRAGRDSWCRRRHAGRVGPRAVGVDARLS